MSKTFASLFTGGALADIGALQAGYDLAWGLELDAEIASVASCNVPHEDKVHVGNVIGFDWRSVQKVDHLHLSPPCQDFSVAKNKKTAHRSNSNDEIANACIEALAELRPHTVTLENVEGYRKSLSFQRIVNWLYGAGYWVDWQILNSADFGVPQTRRRLILRAILGSFLPPLPTKEPWRGWYDAIEDLIPSLPETNFAEWQLKLLPEEFSKTAFIELTNTCRKATCREADEPASTVLASSMRRPSSTPKAFVVNGTANSKGSGVTVVSADDPMFCVTASSSKRGIRGCLLPVGLSTGRVVSMTPRALARFQTVPDWFLLPNNKKSACEIIGNGVPCLMMQRILESFHC